MKRLSPFPLLASLPVHAAELPPALPDAGAGLGQVVLGLIVVIALLWASLYLLKRLQSPRGGVASGLKVVAATAVGPRERVVVVEVGETWLVVGVAPGQVSALSTLPRQELPEGIPAPQPGREFAAWLKNALEKKP
ncbi:MAG: flagellar biosynthetic protein FliO [Rhodocyclaceae bacterium]|nr:flagellar biosynthetic protein FliO [Rhodocyclaceae bacterium]